MNIPEIDFKQLGYIRRCADAGLSQSDMNKLAGFGKRISESDAGAIGRQAASLLYKVAQAGGREHTPSAFLWKKLAHADPWPKPFTPVILGTLAHTVKVANTMEKSARNPLLGFLGGSAGLLRLFALASLASGAAVGGGHWVMNRQVRENAPKVEALRTKADHYTRLSREAEAAMKERQEVAELDGGAKTYRNR